MHHSLTRSLSHPSVTVLQEDVETGTHLDPSLKEINYNPTYDTMFAPEVSSLGPSDLAQDLERYFCELCFYRISIFLCAFVIRRE